MRVVTTSPALPPHPNFNHAHFYFCRGNDPVPRGRRLKVTMQSKYAET